VSVWLRLDHLIIRAADPAATLAELSRRAGAPVLVQPTGAGGFLSGIVRASVDIEVLRIGATPPPRPLGYGLGFTADVPLGQASAELRGLGFPTSAPSGATAHGRSWRAVQVRGLLPDPFPVPASTKAPGVMDRITEAAAGLAMRFPPLAKAATRKAGGSMAVVTEYAFDAAAWRAGAGEGPTVAEVHVGTGGNDWSRLPLAPDTPLRLHPDGPAGVRRVILTGAGEPFSLGDVAFEFAG
jgi:hypothetical protein